MGTSTNNLLVLKELAGNAPTSLDPLQQLLAPHVHELIYFWVAVWSVTAIVLLIRLVREYIEYRGKRR
jgi:hypothetical protein